MSLMNISGHTYATTSDREILVQVMETESAKLTVGEVYSLRFVKKCGDVQPNQHFALAKLGSYVPCYVSSTIVWKERLPFGGGQYFRLTTRSTSTIIKHLRTPDDADAV